MVKLIWQNHVKIGDDPVGFYVYIWAHDDVPRYVGKGVNDSWAVHLTQTSGEFPLNSPYFEKHLPLMACAILKDGLSEDEASRLEIDIIDWHGLLADATGTLFNVRAPAEAFETAQPEAREQPHDSLGPSRLKLFGKHT
jgi:hypothetical protein